MSLLSRSGAHARLRTATSLPLTSRCTTALRAPLAPQARALRTLAAPPAPRKQQQHVAAAAAPQLAELARAFATSSAREQAAPSEQPLPMTTLGNANSNQLALETPRNSVGESAPFEPRVQRADWTWCLCTSQSTSPRRSTRW
jgi:hypothetical protein